MRFGIIGAGYIGPANTGALMKTEGTVIAAVANRTRSKAEVMCRELGLECPVYSDWREMLEKEKPDAVLLNVFNDLHAEYFIECVERGIHVLVEKPLANTYAECQKMMEAVEKNSIRATVLQTQRYGAVLKTARNYIEKNSEKLGKLCGICDTISCNYFWDGRNPWHLDNRRSGGGIVLNYGVHQLDRTHLFLKEKTAVFHAKYHMDKPGISTYSSYVMGGTTESGASYSIQCYGCSDPAVNEMKLFFQNGTVIARLAEVGAGVRGVFVSDGSERFKELQLGFEDGDGGSGMYEREMREAIDYLSGKTDDAPVPLSWGAEMVRLCGLGFEASVDEWNTPGQQLRMKCPELKEAPVLLKEGLSIINSASSEYTEKEFSDSWAEICEELNEKYDRKLYGSMMLSDEKIERGAIYFVREKNGRLISTAALQNVDDPDTLNLHMVGTSANAKGKGAGKAVCAHCVNEAIRRGYKKMILKSDDFRIPAIKIYYKLGFLPVLFASDMRDRWIKIARNIGWDHIEVINEDGKRETVTV